MKKILPVLVLSLVLPLSACGSDDEGDAASDTTITVLAAASLTETFTDLAEQFEAEHDGVTVKLAFDSSATLAQQALEGAPADVLATADTSTMDSATDALAADPEIFATNSLVMITPKDNPAALTGFEDLASADASYVICVDTAPCGKVAAALIAANGLDAEPASLEIDVKAVLAKVISDEADAGFVYATDAFAAKDDVTSFPIPGSEEQITSYPIAALDQSTEGDLAQEFVDLVLSTQGQETLTAAGFGSP